MKLDTKAMVCLALAAALALAGPAYPAKKSKKAPAAVKAKAAAAAPVSGPVLELQEMAHDFGVIMEGGLLEHVFAVRNTGKEELRIESVKPG
jgi:uncharacterized membrane protein YebE (DUF533 family)